MKDRSPYPEVIVAGAPKSGTTSLFAWLSAHPAVCASSVKETYFLMDRDSPLFDPRRNFHRWGPEGYHFFFRECTDAPNLRVEATADYIYQQTPLDVLGKLSETKIIFLLRQPAERAYSAYKFFSGHKSIFNAKVSFSEYIQLIASGGGPDGHPLWPLVAQTVQYGEYARYLEKWRTALGSANIRIYLFEDLVQDPAALLAHIARELGIDPRFYQSFDFAVHNRSYAVKNIRLHRIKNNIAAVLPNSPLKRILGHVYRRINVAAFAPERSDADLETMHRLHRHYQPFNAMLSSQFGLNLDRWQITA